MSVMTRRLRSSPRRPVLCWIWICTGPRPDPSLRGSTVPVEYFSVGVWQLLHAQSLSVKILCVAAWIESASRFKSVIIWHTFLCVVLDPCLTSASVRNCWLKSAQTSFSTLLILSVRDRLRMPNSLRLHPRLLPCGALWDTFVAGETLVDCRVTVPSDLWTFLVRKSWNGQVEAKGNWWDGEWCSVWTCENLINKEVRWRVGSRKENPCEALSDKMVLSPMMSCASMVGLKIMDAAFVVQLEQKSTGFSTVRSGTTWGRSWTTRQDWWSKS